MKAVIPKNIANIKPKARAIRANDFIIFLSVSKANLDKMKSANPMINPPFIALPPGLVTMPKVTITDVIAK